MKTAAQHLGEAEGSGSLKNAKLDMQAGSSRHVHQSVQRLKGPHLRRLSQLSKTRRCVCLQPSFKPFDEAWQRNAESRNPTAQLKHIQAPYASLHPANVGLFPFESTGQLHLGQTRLGT